MDHDIVLIYPFYKAKSEKKINDNIRITYIYELMNILMFSKREPNTVESNETPDLDFLMEKSNLLFSGVVIMSVLRRTLHYDCIVLVKEFRPPIQAYTLEFPAGQSHFTCLSRSGSISSSSSSRS